MTTHRIKRGDTLPSLAHPLPDDRDLTGASVVFNMRGGPIRAEAVIVRVAPPVVGYDFQPGDTAISIGPRPAEFEVTYANGAVETFPTLHGDLVVEIIEDLG